MCFSPAGRGTVQEGKQIEGLKLASRQFRKQGLALLPLCFSPRLTRAAQDESQLQEDASKLEAGSAGRQANSRFEASF